MNLLTDRPCPRCHCLLAHPGDSSLLFCWNCGAPQVILSEELKAQADQIGQPVADANAPAADTPLTPAPADPTAIHWKSIIVATASAAVIFTFISLVLPPLALLMPPLVLAYYASRHRHTRFTASLGARAGLLCGLFTSFGISLLVSLTFVTLRASHQMARFDSFLDALLLQFKQQTIEKSGAAAASLLNPFFTVPEFRVGFCLTEFAFLMSLLLIAMIASGAFTGFLRSRARTV